MDSEDRRLQEDVRALADRFEAVAVSEERVSARIDARLRRPGIGLLATAAVVALVLAGAIGLRAWVLAPSAGAPVMPELVGLFRSVEPDDEGRCVAVRLYDTTVDDGRLAIWSWQEADGCGSRRSTLAAGQGEAKAVELVADGTSQDRVGIRITAAAGVDERLTWVDLVLDPAAFAGDVGAGYWSVQTGGEHTLRLGRVEELRIPYQP